MIPRVTVGGVGDLRRKLERVIGAAKSDEHVGQALKAGALVFGEEIQAAMPRAQKLSRKRSGDRGKLQQSIKKGIRARMTKNGPAYFSAVDRKAAPQGRFLHLGTKRQKARPEIFEGAIRRARGRARNAVMDKLLRIAWDNL